MSAAPNPNDLPPDTDKLVSDAARFLPIGAAAMLARIVMSQEPVSLGWIARRMFFAAVTACIVGWATEGYLQSQGMRFAAVGAAGYAAPEVADFALNWIKAKGKAEVAKVKGKGKKR